jgi:biotin carboxylase
MKKIAVLGAGYYNFNVYKKLREGGFYTIAFDGNKDAPAAAYADTFVNLNFSDKNILLDYLKANPVDAIMPINDWGTVSAAFVSKKLGLKGISEQAAIAATDKGIMRDTWSKNGIPNPRYFIFSTLEELKEKIQRIGFPCVIKPTDSGGSGRGISVLKSVEDIEWAYDFAKPYVRNNRFICESFFDGVELTIETISIEGEVYVLAMSDKEKPDLKTRVATSLNYPAKLDKKQEALVQETVKKAIKALGIHTGMAHTEVIINNMELVMVESGARGGGGHIFHTIIEAVSGINAPVAYAKLLTETFDMPTEILKKGAVYRFFNPTYGILKKVIGLEDVKKWNGILDIGILKKEGEVVGDLKNSLERAGYIVSIGVDRETALEIAKKAENAIHLEIL